MISFFKKLRRDRRGNALVIAGAALPLVMGCAGIACDTIQWTLWKRQLQRAADSAAMAGVYAVVDGKSHSDGVDRDLTTNNHAKNDHSGVTLTKHVSQPTVTGYSNAVRVVLAVQKRLTFSSMFMSAVPTISAEATAAVSKEGSYCVVALNNTSSPSIIINGNISLNMGCGIISNSTSTSTSALHAGISAAGNSHSVNAVPVASVGTVPDLNGTTAETSYQLKQSDPYAGKYSTDIPGDQTCRTLHGHIAAKGETVAGGYSVIDPGCYHRIGNGSAASNQAFSTSGDKIAMNPGTYYIKSADFDIGALSNIKVNSPTGSEGVTIILTGDTPGRVNISANATLNLRAPSSGDYSKMLFIQNAGATAASTISGNSSSSYDGAFYFPSTEVNYAGNAADTFKCAMIVGNVVSFSGTSNVQNNTDGCEAYTKVTVERVRLIA